MAKELHIKTTGNGIHVGLVLLSRDMRVVGLNEYALRLVGPQMEMMGKNLVHYHPEKSREKVRSLLEELSSARGEMPNTMIIDVLGKVLMTNMSRLTVLPAADTAAWALTFMDVTEQTGAAKNPDSGLVELIKLPIYENGVFHFLSADQVYSIEADGNYCRIFTTSKTFYLLMSLKAVLQRFATRDFFRAHKSFIVNLQHIRTIDQSAGQGITISFDDPAIPAVPVSRRRASALKKTLALS